MLETRRFEDIAILENGSCDRWFRSVAAGPGWGLLDGFNADREGVSLANPDQYSSVTAENFVASATTHAGTFALQSCDALCAAGVQTGTTYFAALQHHYSPAGSPQFRLRAAAHPRNIGFAQMGTDRR
jgi:hypothetical protein